jgi:hypothetical protein
MKIFFFFFFFFFFTFQLNLRFQVVATAVARVYKSMHGSWSYTNHMGAVTLVKEHATHMLKLINLDSGNVEWSQELYEGFEYNAPKAFFHTFEGDDACYAFSFADESDPAAFRSAVQAAAPANSSTSGAFSKTPGGPPPLAPASRGPPPRAPAAATPLNASHDDDSSSSVTNAEDAAAAMAANAAANAASANKEEKSRKGRFGLQGVMGTMRGLKARVIGEKEPDVEISAPRDFRHLSSIGWTPENGFEIRNIPPEWRKLFQAAGVKKSELKDKETAAFVMDIIQKEGGVELLQNGGGGGGDAPAAAAPSAPPPPAPPMPPANAPKAPVPPPAPKRPGTAAPAAAAAGGGGGQRGGLLDQIKQGKELKSVETTAPPVAAAPPSANLAETLAMAMTARRGAMQQKPTKSSVLDDEDDNDEWSQ